MQQTILAIRQVFRERRSYPAFGVTAIIFFGLFITIPVITIPGNNFLFQLSIFRSRDYLLMIFLALLVGFNFTFQMYIWRQRRTNQNLSQPVSLGTASGVLGIFGAIAGTAACASCLAVLFGLIGLGAGSVFFVLKNQSYFLFGTIALMLISFYYLAQKVNKACTSC